MVWVAAYVSTEKNGDRAFIDAVTYTPEFWHFEGGCGEIGLDGFANPEKTWNEEKKKANGSRSWFFFEVRLCRVPDENRKPISRSYIFCRLSGLMGEFDKERKRATLHDVKDIEFFKDGEWAT